jgi:hypothetical protein
MSVASFSSQSIFALRENMKIQTSAPIGILLLGSVTVLWAMNGKHS